MFATKIDKRSRSQMVAFLEKHFRYYTMNSWNRLTSYANCVKLYNLQIPPELNNKAYDFLSAECIEYDADIECIREEFYHKTGYTFSFNGRNNGYIVLYDTKIENDRLCVMMHGVDQYEDFSDWSMDMLKERVELIQEFDECCDRIRDTFLNYIANTTIKTIKVPCFEIKTIATCNDRY